MSTSPSTPDLPRWAIAGTLALAAAMRAGTLVLAPDALAADPDGYRAVAENLVEHGTLGHGNVPTAFRPPLYPLLVAGCLAFGPYGRTALGGLHLALGVATVWLTLALARRCGLKWGAVLAAALVACDPILLRQSTLVMTETPAALFTAAGLLALTSFSERPGPLRAATAGGIIALGALCRPELLVWGMAAAVGIAWAAKGERAGLKAAAAFLAAVCVVLAPWTARNWLQLGRPVAVTTHGGYTLLLANNQWLYRHLRAGGAMHTWDPAEFHQHWGQERGLLSPHDEVTADHVAYSQALAKMRSEPGTFLRAATARVSRLWQLAPHGGGQRETASRTAARWLIGAWYGVESLLTLLGLWAVCGRKWGGPPLYAILGWGVLLAATLTAVHALYWTDMRMRAPLAPWLAVAAAAATAWLAASLGRRNSHLDIELAIRKRD